MNPFRLAVAAMTLAALPACGYIRLSLNYSDGSSSFIRRSDATTTGVQFYINSLIVSGVQSRFTGTSVTVISSGSNPVDAAQSAIATWNGVTTSAIKFLALQLTTGAIDSKDARNTIAIGNTSTELSILGFKPGGSAGALAVTVSTVPNLAGGTTPSGDLTDSDIIINPAYAFSTDGSTPYDLQSVLTHEIGHALGLNHSALVGATMFPYNSSQRFLSSDELTFAAAVYPSHASSLGTLSGKVITSGGSAVQNALVEMIDTANGNSLSLLTAADGTYSLPVPAGSYALYAEPLGGIVGPANFYLAASAQVTTGFQASVAGGPASPSRFTVTPANTTLAPDLAVTPGATSIQLPYVGFGKAGANGDIGSVAVTNAPVTIASGQSMDIGMIGGGVDSTISIYVIGHGISVRAGSTRVDSGVSFSGSLSGMPLVRATLDIAAVSYPTLASVIITKGSNTIALTGALVIVPPTPVFTSQSVVSAASYVGSTSAGGVSPGGIYSIYDTTSNSLGPNPYVQPSGYDLNGDLATTLGGVSVTFDGVPAPLYLAYAGQLNLQVPFEVAGKPTSQVVVNYYGSKSAPVSVPVTKTQPAFFTFTPKGSDAIAQNFPDYSLNGPGNPISRGGIVLLYGTGLGSLPYPLATGQPGTVPPSGYSSTWSCSFGNQKSSAYAYWNYGFVGEATWTVAVPSASPIGAVPIACTDSVSGSSTQQGVIYVK